ncbi:SURF1 family protein [Rhodobacteraceae bacterium CCMM004]|nr:SURF1 family protein [Rhodobacteraceae bacterium CCMM004]
MRWIGLAILGLGGVAVLVRLGIWQLDRLEEKTAYIARIEAGIAAMPVPLPPAPTAEDEFLPVAVTGEVGDGALRFVHSANASGLVVPLATPEGRVLADLGLIAPDAMPDLAGAVLSVEGNLAFPQGDGEGLRPDAPNPWTQRNVAAMADLLDTRPVLVVARRVDPAPAGVRPFPITTDGIPNNHLGYAVQWFGMAAVWAGMAGLLGWRMMRRSV